jgi:hypothetical protein
MARRKQVKARIKQVKLPPPSPDWATWTPDQRPTWGMVQDMLRLAASADPPPQNPKHARDAKTRKAAKLNRWVELDAAIDRDPWTPYKHVMGLIDPKTGKEFTPQQLSSRKKLRSDRTR